MARNKERSEKFFLTEDAMGYTPWQRWLLLAVMGLFAALLVAGNLALSLHWIHKPFPGFFVYENLTVGPYALP